MAYIRRRDGQVKPTATVKWKKKELQHESIAGDIDDQLHRDMDGEYDQQEYELDRIFKKNLDIEFPYRVVRQTKMNEQ